MPRRRIAKIDPGRRGLVEAAILGLALLAHALWRLGDRLSA